MNNYTTEIASMPVVVPCYLSQREYFAAVAFQGLLANGDYGLNTGATARMAVEMADALIRILNTPKEERTPL